ncbi:SRPBCC family protein [Sinimarinibacterium thermocellulolyticum]|uniref:SRPBCC family protein n=1 Tax=Sinimarinibacterium thermocellulolyticum TaxID=3170016 RepID=A0ABV2A8B1_9GAMM
MRLLKWLLVTVAVLVLGLVGVGLFLPDEARLERSVVVDAPPATVYTALNGFRRFNEWSPWAGLDPDARYTDEGPPVGVGAKQSWNSEDPAVGSGSQQIVEVEPFERIRMRLAFAGFDSENYASYTLARQGEGTRVTWGYESRFYGNLMARYFGLMLDRMLGPQYEQGLAKLKPLLESLPKDDLSTLEVTVMQVEPQPIVYQSGSANAADAAEVLGGIYARLSAHMAANGLSEAAPPIAITREYDEETGTWRFDAAMIVDRADPPAAEGEGIRAGTTYGGWVARAVHTGPYADSDATYRQLMTWRIVAGLQDNGDRWEQYVSDPGTTPESELKTHIYWPIK